jgi:hypothetical protein
VECYACLELKDAALANFKNIKPYAEMIPTDVETGKLLVPGEPVHALLIFPDDETMMNFDLAVKWLAIIYMFYFI